LDFFQENKELVFMKIGIVTTWQERGAAYVSRQYYDSLKNNNEIFIYARGGENYAIGDKNWDGENVTWGKKIPIHLPASINLGDFKKWILKNKLDVVFFNEQQWWMPVLLCKKLGVKIGSYVDYYTKETVPFFAVFDFLICNTKRHHEAFKWHPQAFYVPWGTDIKLFKNENTLPVNKEYLTFFHSCGMSSVRKGTDILIKSFYKLTGKKKLIIHSQVDLTTELPSLKNIINEMVSGGLLEIINMSVSAPGLYHLGDVYVYPSRLEGIGLTICEALACGLPVITSNNQPMNEFIDSNNGKLVAISKFEERSDGYYWPQCEVSEESLVEEMQYYVNNFNLISEFKYSARKSAEEKFDWHKNSLNVPEIFATSKKLTCESKIINDIINFEDKRATFAAKIYKKFPFLFKPFDWFWPIIKRMYILNK